MALDVFDVEVLLPKPKGIMISVKCNIQSTFGEVKDKVWQKINKMANLGDKDKFSFEGINKEAHLERYEDDKTLLKDSKLYTYLLKLVEVVRTADIDDKKFIADLSMLCGRNVCQADTSYPSFEVQMFHELMEETAINYQKLGCQYDARQQLTVKYPINTGPLDSSLVEFETEYHTMQYTVYVESALRIIPDEESGPWEKVDNFLVPFRTSVKVVLEVLVHIEKLITTNKYLLKVAGIEDFLLDDSLILPEYQYIQSCIRDNKIPILVLTTFEEVLKTLDTRTTKIQKEIPTQLDTFPLSPLHFQGDPSDVFSCDVPEPLSITIRSLTDLTDLYRNYMLTVYVALYSGTDRLEQFKTSEKPLTSVVEWNETITFKMNISDIPRNAKLCFTIQKRRRTADDTKKNKKQNVTENPEDTAKKTGILYWINISVFDFMGTLRSGHIEQHVWSDLRIDSSRGFYSSGTCFPYSLTDTPIFSADLPLYNDKVIFYPTYTAYQLALSDQGPGSLFEAEQSGISEADLAKLQKIVAQGPFNVSEEDKDFIWQHRVTCRHIPESLPLLAVSQNFDTLQKSSQLYTLLRDWGPITVTTALQCFINISDPHIRDFAVYSLDKLLTDEMVQLYSLQLVECLKHDLYLDCSLTRFLIRRALGNNILGHHLYWHLKSQVETLECHSQFALIIELYLRCCGDHLKELNKISQVVAKLSGVYDRIKSLQLSDAERDMRSVLNNPGNANLFSMVQCLTSSRLRAKDILAEKTKLFDSSMRPVCLKFSNQDPTVSTEFGFIYKVGDDLRQDQLVLQFIQLIDKIWLSEGIDMKLIGYSATCTRSKSGIIEYIANAENLARLIKKYRTYEGFQHWFQEKNPNSADLEEVRLNFMKSCCGYTLIQYVLGIADRHPSNIMLSEDGRLIHIDFGHILGNRKFKFGVCREPSPFIFLKEWVDFISNNDDKQFNKFEQLFVRGYLVLRQHSDLILTLWHLMLPVGLKEVNLENLEYLESALCVNKSEDEAERKLLKLLHESIRMTEQVHAQWFPHLVRRK